MMILQIFFKYLYKARRAEFSLFVKLVGAAFPPLFSILMAPDDSLISKLYALIREDLPFVEDT